MKTVLLKTGETLLLRKPEPDDAANMVSYLNTVGGESDFLLFGKNEFRFSVEQEKQFIENINREKASLMLLAAIDEEIVGVAVLSSGTRKRTAHTSELSLSVAAKHWGKGVGTAMMRELIDFARGTGTLAVIHLSVFAENARARALYQKMGFEEIGMYRDAVRIDGKSSDTVLMNLYL